MPHCYRNSLICFLFVMIPAIGNTSGDRQYDADAIVTMRNHQPCFSYPTNEEKLFGYHLTVSKKGTNDEAVWDIQIFDYDKKNIPEPNIIKNCIEYGIPKSETEVKRAATPLVYDTPYMVFISVAESPTGGQRYRYLRTFLNNFCVTRNENGEPVITGADWGDKGWHCMLPEESSKRGFWQKLFGK